MSNLSFEDYKKKYSQNLERITVENKGIFEVLWHGFDSSLILNKETGKQEFVSNGSIGLPKRPRYTYKNRF